MTARPGGRALPGEQRDDFGVDLPEPQRTPTDFRNAQVFSLPMETGPPRGFVAMLGTSGELGWLTARSTTLDANRIPPASRSTHEVQRADLVA